MINGPTVVIGLINGMIGGVILVLPLLALQAGTIVTGLVIIISGAFSYYSSMLCVKHLGNSSDLDQALLHHFNQNKCVSVFYDLIVFVNLAFLLILYFNLITQQWEGIIQLQQASVLNSVLNGIVLFSLVFYMKYFDFGASLLAYGIISIIGYCIFLVWLVTSAPEGTNVMPKSGDGAIEMAASMGTAFSIQTFFIPILKKNKNQDDYQFYTMLAYLIGGSIYMYIAYSGSFGILQRIPSSQSPETVQDYFSRDHWQVYSLELIYLVHLYSVFPQFLLIGKKRFFNAFEIPNSVQGQIPYAQLIFTVALIVICLTISLTNVKIQAIIQVNGAVVGFFFIYFLPLIMHIKCIYLSKNNKYTGDSTSQLSNSGIQIVTIQKSVGYNESNIQNSDISDQNSYRISSCKSEPFLHNNPPKFVCKAEKSPYLVLQILDWIMLLGMMSVGIFIMYGGLVSVFSA